MAPIGENADGPGGPADADEEAPAKEGGLGSGGGGYVPPHLRKGGAATGERMGGKYERDDLATLRVTNVRSSRRHNSLFKDALMLEIPGLGVRRRERSSRDLRTLWPCYPGFSCKGQGDRKSEGFRFHQLPGKVGRC